jgi:5-methylcytosine-specific restriction enzyme subunit McrC
MSEKQTRIPVANIFFMLAYAWDIPPTWQKRVVDESDYDSLWELLARLLIESTEGIFKRGLARDYVLNTENICGAKGRLDPGRTYRSLAWNHARTVCAYDEFEPDIPINRGIKAAIYRLLRSSGKKLEKKTRENLKKIYQRFGEITLIESDAQRLLHSVKLQRHQLHYFFPVEVCKFILANTTFNENDGKYTFMDFERDHQKMATLFEHFIFNYYKKHLKDWKVKREIINWAVDEGGIGIDFLPEMRTDITLERKDQKMVIDAKFYQEPMKTRFEGSARKFTSANLYQLNAYLLHLAGSSSHCCNAHAEGMLLYPVLKPIPRLDVNMLGHRIRVESIDLNQGWREIGERLRGLVN